jgi:hypothetical protein
MHTTFERSQHEGKKTKAPREGGEGKKKPNTEENF